MTVGVVRAPPFVIIWGRPSDANTTVFCLSQVQAVRPTPDFAEVPFVDVGNPGKEISRPQGQWSAATMGARSGRVRGARPEDEPREFRR